MQNLTPFDSVPGDPAPGGECNAGDPEVTNPDAHDYLLDGLAAAAEALVRAQVDPPGLDPLHAALVHDAAVHLRMQLEDLVMFTAGLAGGDVVDIEALMAGFAAGEWGGCDQCDADVAVVHHADGVGVVEIRHEPACPELARHR